MAIHLNELSRVIMNVFGNLLKIPHRDRILNKNVREKMGADGSLMTDVEGKTARMNGLVQGMEDIRLLKKNLQQVDLLQNLSLIHIYIVLQFNTSYCSYRIPVS